MCCASASFSSTHRILGNSGVLMEGEAGLGEWFSSLSTTAKAVMISSGIVTAAGVGFLLYRNFFSDSWYVTSKLASIYFYEGTMNLFLNTKTVICVSCAVLFSLKFGRKVFKSKRVQIKLISFSVNPDFSVARAERELRQLDKRTDLREKRTAQLTQMTVFVLRKRFIVPS